MGENMFVNKNKKLKEKKIEQNEMYRVIARCTHRTNTKTRSSYQQHEAKSQNETNLLLLSRERTANALQHTIIHTATSLHLHIITMER